MALVGVVVATFTDWKTRRVPNWLTVSLALVGVIYSTYMYGLIGTMGSFAGASTGLVLLLYPFAMGWMGGGDVKLLVAIGALLGARAVIWVALYGAVAGGIGALVLVVYRMAQAGVLLAQVRLSLVAIWLGLAQLSAHTWQKKPKQTLPATRAALREKFPYAFALAAGTVIALWRNLL
jgi:prepilin peptidase CpaA